MMMIADTSPRAIVRVRSLAIDDVEDIVLSDPWTSADGSRLEWATEFGDTESCPFSAIVDVRIV